MSLLDLLGNTLVLNHISPYLGLASTVQLAATSKPFQTLIYRTPGVFRHADLTKLAPPLCSSDRPDCEHNDLGTADSFHGGPVRRVLQGLQYRNVLHDVRTLILDETAVPLTLLTKILTNRACNVRILSLRGVKDLGEEDLMELLHDIISPFQLKGTPKLKGLYYFTPIRAREKSV